MGIKDEIIKDIELGLGGGMVDVELDSAHYDLVINQALRKYRQRSAKGSSEKFIPLDIKAEQQVYQLPLNVVMVRDVLLGQTGSAGTSGTGVDFEPFDRRTTMGTSLPHRIIGIRSYSLAHSC